MSTVYYSNQLGSGLGDRMSFDQSVPYTLCCNYKGYNVDTATQKFCIIESPGYYSLDSAETKVVLGKEVSVVLSDCWINLEVPSGATGGYSSFNVALYVGTTEDVVSNDTVYLYRCCPYILAGDKLKIKIPDVTGFVVPSGKNIILSIYSGGASYVSAHFVSSVDD